MLTNESNPGARDNLDASRRARPYTPPPSQEAGKHQHRSDGQIANFLRQELVFNYFWGIDGSSDRGANTQERNSQQTSRHQKQELLLLVSLRASRAEGGWHAVGDWMAPSPEQV